MNQCLIAHGSPIAFINAILKIKVEIEKSNRKKPTFFEMH